MSLPLHDALVELVHPGSLTLRADGRRLALIGVSPAPAVHVSDPTDPGAAPVSWPLDTAPYGVRWAASGERLWAVTAGDHGEATRLSLLDTRGSVVATTSLDGSIEDLVPLDASSVLLRVADVGSDRDGMNLGLRVRGPRSDDPQVRRSDDLPLRRLVRVSLTADTLEHTTLDLGRWSVWDVHAVGDRAVVVASTDPAPAGYYRPTLLVVDRLDASRPEVRELYRTDAQLARPRLSPDGERVAVVEGRSIVAGVVHLVDVRTRARKTVPGLDDVTDLGWLDEGRLWFAGWDDLGVQVGRLAVDGPGGRGRITDRWTHLATMHGDSGQPSLEVAPDGITAYAVWEAPGLPPEVVALSTVEPGVRPLTDHNADLRDRAATAASVVTEPRAWTSPDGTTVHGLLLRPAAARGPLPLVVLLHGGPTWLWSASFAPGESNQLALPLAAAGAAVLLPNPRGSSGRGQAYAAQVAGDVGGGDLADVLAGIDHLVADGVADPGRVAVMGLSYGGYLTAQAAATDGRFRAAVVMSGVTDWLGFVTTSAIGGGYDRTYHPAGDLTSPAGREALAARSPLYYAGATTAPTLILHGELDRITPLPQAEQLFRRLSCAGVPTELVVYPREGHELVEPEHRRDAAARVARWLRDHGVLDGTEG